MKNNLNPPTLAVSIDKVGNIPFDRPYFHGHLTAIQPKNTVIITFEPNDAGCIHIAAPFIELKKTASTLNFFAKAYKLLKSGYHLAVSRKETQRLCNFLIEHKVEVVLAEEGPAGCAMLPACRRAGIPLYTHFHGGDIGVGERSWKMRRAYRHMAKHAAGVISPSHYLAKKLEAVGFAKDKIHVAHCGVNTSDFHPADEYDPMLLIAIGRFIPKKAPYRTVEAFAKVLQTFPEAKLEMIGTGPLLEETISRAKELGVQKSITFNSTNTNNDYVRKRLREAAVFVQHSVTAPRGDVEAFGITPVEAMASGVPPVVTRHNGFVETVLDGETGFLTPEHDVDAMAEAIIKILSDSHLRERMSKAGRERAEKHFSADRNIERLREILITI